MPEYTVDWPPAEWAEFHSTRVPDGEWLIRDVIEVARARPQAA